MRVGRWMCVVLRMLLALSGALVYGTGAGMASGSPAHAGDPTPPSTSHAAARHADDDQRDEVVGGVRAKPGEFPWIVRLSVGCAGALTAPRWVLTAGHCVKGTGRDSGIVVTAGSVDSRSDKAIQVRSTYVRRAAGFTSATAGDDWAVVRLERDLDLPTLPLATTTAYDRGRFTILGWGATSEGGAQERYLRTTKVSSVDDRTCGRAYRAAGYTFVPDEMLCAGDTRRGGVDTCQGDSGGPMVRRDAQGRWVQVGIVSWGHGCARREYPGVYTQVSTFAADIADAVAASS